MKIKETVLTLFYNIGTRILEKHKKNGEVNKFRDKRRVSIWSKIIFTDNQKKQIDDYFFKNYGKRIPYTWHRHYTAFTGNFDVTYIPESMYIPEFERYMNQNHSYKEMMADKNIISYIAKIAGVKYPKRVLSNIDGEYLNKNDEVLSYSQSIDEISNVGCVFAKPSKNTGSGVGCRTLTMKGGMECESNKTAETIVKELGTNFIVQELITCHESIKKLYPKSVNTFRIITYRWKNDILHMPIIMRIGQGGGVIDNAHAGGIFIAVDDNGTLHKTAFTEFKEEYTAHPDTKIVFEGYKIIGLEKVIVCAKKLHSLVPEVGVYNWDFTIDDEGIPVLIEANTSGGSIWMAQMSHGTGVFGKQTEDVLKWMKFIKKIKPSERKNYKYGKMPI